LYRDSQNFENFSVWMLALHFIYFQLPLKSRALAFFHPASFLGASVVPACYIFLNICKPSLEKDHMETWELSWLAVLLRSMILHFGPTLFHLIDIIANQEHLISSYQTKPKKFQSAWSFLSFYMFYFVYYVMTPSISDEDEFQTLTKIEFTRAKIVIILIVSFLTYCILHWSIIRKAYPGKVTKRSQDKFWIYSGTKLQYCRVLYRCSRSPSCHIVLKLI